MARSKSDNKFHRSAAKSSSIYLSGEYRPAIQFKFHLDFIYNCNLASRCRVDSRLIKYNLASRRRVDTRLIKYNLASRRRVDSRLIKYNLASRRRVDARLIKYNLASPLLVCCMFCLFPKRMTCKLLVL